MKKFIILILSLFLITGCSYKELNELAIVSSVGIDYVDDHYLISLQIMDLQKGSGDSTTEKAVLYKGTGITIVEALRNIMKEYPKTIYFGHLELAVLGRDVAEDKTDEIFDYFISSPESSNDFMVLVHKDGLALDIIDPKKSSNEETNPTKDLLTSLENIKNRDGSSYEINFEEFLALYLEVGKDPVIPVVKLVDDKDAISKVMITTLVPFKDNMLLDELSDKQAIAFNTLNNNYYDIPFTAKYNDTNISLLMINPKSSYDVKLEDNKVNVNLNIKLEGHASEVATRVILSTPKVANEIEEIFEEEIKNYVISLIDYCKNNDVDILGLKNMIYKNYYKDFNNYKDKNIYEIANMNIDVNVSMYRYGNAYVGVSKD